jgi:hypothetical protein
MVIAETAEEGPHAAARRDIAVVARTAVAIIAIHRGMDAQSGGFITAVLRARVDIVTHRAGAAADESPTLVHAGFAGRTEASVFASVASLERVSPADPAVPTGI